jgi:uncharacterized protein YwqG
MQFLNHNSSDEDRDNGKSHRPKESARVEQLLRGAQDWQLLLQLDTDPMAEMLWGIEGRCYYWIQTQALQKQQFENVRFIMQWT